MSKQYVIPLYNCLEINKQPVNQNIIEKVEWQETKLIVENSEIYNSTNPLLKVETNNSGNVTNVEIQDLNDYKKYVTISNNIKYTYIYISFSIKADIKFNIDTLKDSYTESFYGYDDSWTKGESKGKLWKLSSLDEVITGPTARANVYYEEKSDTKISGTIVLLASNESSSFTRLSSYQVTLTVDEYKKQTENVYEGKATTNNIFHMETNEFLHLGYKEAGSGKAKRNAKNILSEYQKGKQTIELKVVTNKYYDLEGNLMIDNELGEIPRVGDTFYLMSGGKNNFNYSHTNNILYKITSSEFNYDGVPKLVIKAKEV